MDKIPPPPPPPLPPLPQRHVAPKTPTPRPQNAAIPIPPSSQETHPPQEFIDTDGQDEEAPPFEAANGPSTPLSEEDNQEKYLPVQETDPAPQALYDPQQQDEHTMDGDSTGEEKLI